MKKSYPCVLLGCSLLVSGCQSQSTVADAWPSQPLSRQLVPLESHIKIYTGIPFRSRGELIWEDKFGQQYESSALAIRAEGMANEAGYDTLPVNVDDVEWHKIATYATQNPLSLSSFSSLYRQTIVIVCVDPLVIAISQLPIGTAYGGADVNARPYQQDELRHNNHDRGGFIVGLPAGIVYGTEIPFGDGKIAILSTDLDLSVMTDIASYPVRVELPSGAVCIKKSSEVFLVAELCQ